MGYDQRRAHRLAVCLLRPPRSGVSPFSRRTEPLHLQEARRSPVNGEGSRTHPALAVDCHLGCPDHGSRTRVPANTDTESQDT